MSDPRDIVESSRLNGANEATATADWERLERTGAKLLAACKAALRKVQGKNIMGEEVEPRLVAKLRDAIAEAEAWPNPPRGAPRASRKGRATGGPRRLARLAAQKKAPAQKKVGGQT